MEKRDGCVPLKVTERVTLAGGEAGAMHRTSSSDTHLASVGREDPNRHWSRLPRTNPGVK